MPSETEEKQSASQYGPLEQVPAEYLGHWKLIREECDPEFELVPSTDLPEVQLTFSPDHSYELIVEGWRSMGTFTVNSYVDNTRLSLDDTLLSFASVEGRLENWSEGDAVYQCGNVFERTD